MNPEQKTAALFAVAEAFYDRGEALQYDQLSMDRAVRISPRHSYYLPPEAATPQHRAYLDCSTFVCAAYYNAFGYVPESNLTWHMRELVQDRVFCYVLTHEETPEELDALRRQLRDLLQPGDVVVYSKATNGHALLYRDPHTFYHCTQHGAKGSYDYAARRDIVSPHGGMYMDDSRWLLEPCTDPDGYGKCYLFAPDIERFAVLRPLNRVEDPTPDALARLGDARDLSCSVTVSHPGARTAAPGDEVTYRVQVRSRRDTPVQAEIRFRTPEGNLQTRTLALDPGETGTAGFTLRAPAGPGPLARPRVWVNGLSVWTPPLRLGRNLTAAEADGLVRDVLTAAPADGLLQTVAVSCGLEDLPCPADLTRWLNTLFYRYDALSADVLYRLPQDPARDLAVYAYFGGAGVITPEAVADSELRTQQLRLEELQKGDLLVCCDDALLQRPMPACTPGTASSDSPRPMRTCRPSTGTPQRPGWTACRDASSSS